MSGISVPVDRARRSLQPGEVALHVADLSQLRSVTTMLAKAALPIGGVEDLVHQRGVVVASTGAYLVGAAGLEHHGPDRLLRSVVVEAPWRGLGVGHRLVSLLLAQASADEADAYPLTEITDGLIRSGGQCRTSSRDATRASTRPRISSRIGRTASTVSPAGSSSSQSS